MNPHQVPASAQVDGTRELPFRVLNGSLGYINLLDALKAWQIVRELSLRTKLPSATSIKHTNPVGAGIGLSLSDELRTAYGTSRAELSPLAAAYLRARSGDPAAAYGDFIGLSHVVDASAANIISPHVSDGIIAPGYTTEALKVLIRKKGGAHLILQMDESFEPFLGDEQVLFGVRLQQPRNDAPVDTDMLANRVTLNKVIPEDSQRDLILATIVVKYANSNATCIAYGGQALGVGVGQQSRIASTRIACDKSDQWLLRMHPRVAALTFSPDVKLSQRANAILQFIRWSELSACERRSLGLLLRDPPEPLEESERIAWLRRYSHLALSSDGCIPFRDNLDRAANSGVRYVVQSGGSLRDSEITNAADEHGMCMVHSGIRLFHH